MRLLVSAALLLMVIDVSAALSQTNPARRSYRGSIGDKHIEMQLNVSGNSVSGAYSYDQFRQEIKLSGAYNPSGQLELNETPPGSRKPTGKFACKRQPETFDADVECDWSRMDGTGKAFVVLYEQHLAFSNGIDIVPKVINDRRSRIMVSYPQLSGSAMGSSAASFNELITSLVQKAIKDFLPETPGTGRFDTTYAVLFGGDELVSIEMQEYSDVGAAHPNTRLWTLNYDLKTNKQLSLEDVFQSNSDYKTALADYVAKDINRRADQMEKDEARRTGTQPQKRDEPVMTADQLPVIYAWAMTSKGLAVYFDFPHVLAVFDKTIVPYEVVRSYLRPDGPTRVLIR